MGKTKAACTLIAAAALAGCLGLAACAQGGEGQASSAGTAGATYGLGQPPLQPYADHNGRWEYGGATLCYGCHGAGQLSNPMNAYAPAIPDDHYVDASAQTRQLDGVREQCIQCHPVEDPSSN